MHGKELVVINCPKKKLRLDFLDNVLNQLFYTCLDCYRNYVQENGWEAGECRLTELKLVIVKRHLFQNAEKSSKAQLVWSLTV